VTASLRIWSILEMEKQNKDDKNSA